MKVAVLMSTYNGERFLRQQIESILNQSGDFQLDLWVRDDGSQDETCAILQEYADQGKLHWCTGENLKPARSFLKLVQQVWGYDYYAFSDQDDVWHSDKLSRGVQKLQTVTGPAVYCANARLVDAELNDLGRDVYMRPLHTDFYSVTCGAGILGCTMVFNDETARLIREKPMPEKFRMHDCYMSIVCTLHDGVVFYDPEVCMDYRQHGNNVVGTSWSKWDALKNRIGQITQKREQTIDKMASSICSNYPDAPNREKLEWLRSVAQYRNSFLSAAKLATDNKPIYNSLNKSLTLRLAILLRNR